jgi:hypothetical protein
MVRWRLRGGMWLVPVLTVLALGCGAVTVPALAVTSAVPQVKPGACGSVLLAGPVWLGGQGVDVKSNGPDQGSGTSCGGKKKNTVNGIPSGLEWQCVELVNRLYLTRGWISATWPGNGGRSSPTARDSMFDLAPRPLSGNKQANGSITSVGPGDVVSINVYKEVNKKEVFQADGHVLIVNSAGPVTSGKVALVSQNGGGATAAIVQSTATLSGGTLTIPSSGIWSYSVIGVVHAPTRVAGWQATEAPAPAAAAADPGQVLRSVACASASSCVAAGNYIDLSGTDQGLLETLSGTNWTAVKAPLPAGAAANPQPYLQSVSCGSASSCVAAGDYTDSSGNGQGVLETLSGTTWTAVKAPLPAGAAADPQAGLQSVSCASASSCVAAGDYTDSSGSQRGLLETLSGTTWAPVKAPLPAGAAADPQSDLESVSCASVSSCVVGGRYADSSDPQLGLLETLSGTTWTATKAPVPAGARAAQDTDLTSSACAPASSCVAVGFYFDSSSNLRALLETLSGTTWTATSAPAPAGAAADPNPELFSVSCASPSSCVAAGYYTDSSGNQEGLLETLSGAKWTATEAPVPASGGAEAEPNLQSVACVPASSCVAVGNYYDSSSDGQGLLETGPG